MNSNTNSPELEMNAPNKDSTETNNVEPSEETEDTDTDLKGGLILKSESKFEHQFSILIEVEAGSDSSQNRELESAKTRENNASETNESQNNASETNESQINASETNECQNIPGTSQSTENSSDDRLSGITATLKRINENLASESSKKPKYELFTTDKGPMWYSIPNDLVTPPIITKNLPKVYESLQIFGKPNTRGDLDKFYDDEIRNFIGCDLEDEEFKELGKYCSVEHLKTGKELNLKWDTPTLSILSSNEIPEIDLHTTRLCTTRKYKTRNKVNLNPYLMRLKYRGLRMLPLAQVGADEDPSLPCELNPGKDILLRARIYRPFIDNSHKDRNTRSRTTVFSCDIMVLGRQTLCALRDRIACHNDYDMRVDISNTPSAMPTTTAKDVFPSGFLFINNVFYIDTRKGCVDNSAVVRAWAKRKGMGDFPCRPMSEVKLEDIVIKLGHPDVYVHQGSCEHVFTFSEVRCVTSRDPLRLSAYPAHTAVTHNQSVYCTTCAEFQAKWIVSACARVPFDPAFFCDTCFRQYLYRDGKKIGDFKAYAYRGNELNPLKPFG